jgi:hypothetical protein
MKTQTEQTEWKTFKISYRGKSKRWKTHWQVSQDGRIRTWIPHTDKYEPVQPSLSGGNPGSRYLCLADNQYKYVHRIVAEAFIPNPNKYPAIDHIDGDKTNNHVSNLEWVTYRENSKRYWAKKQANK